VKKRIFAWMTVLVFSASVVFAAGSVNTPTKLGSDPTIQEYKNSEGKLVRKIKWSWSSTSGTSTADGGYVSGQVGKILKAWADAGTTNQPDDNYDIEIRLGADGVGHDVLYGYGYDMPQDFSDESCRFTPLDSSGNFSYLFGDTISFHGKYLNTAGTADGDFYILLEVFEPNF